MCVALVADHALLSGKIIPHPPPPPPQSVVSSYAPVSFVPVLKQKAYAILLFMQHKFTLKWSSKYASIYNYGKRCLKISHKRLTLEQY